MRKVIGSILLLIALCSNCFAAEFTEQDISAFLDGVLPLQLKREDVAGAVVVIVKDGNIFFSKGYGFSDSARRKPVSVEETLFRPGSISKLFTWTSIMQLVEQGKLDLDRDVNTYLDFKIPATFSAPITIRHLMTHSAGFEETVKNLFAPSPQDLIPLGTYLKTHIPERIFPVGESPAYSNYGTALAGYIVERVSGESFNQYVANHIFKPLGMSRSTFEQPLPSNLKTKMSNGYNLGSGDPVPFELVNAFPAGSLSSSAGDMARFMIAHLQDGSFQGQQILQPDTAKQMHSRQLPLHEKMNAMALGFYEETRNGMRIIGHGGDTVAFHSDLHLIPEKQIGFYISYNSAGKGEISGRSAVWEELLDRYFPYSPQPAAKNSGSLKNADIVSGSYAYSRRNDSSIFKLPYLLLQVGVSKNSDGTILIDQFKDLNGQTKHWREIEPMVFREVNGQELVVFKRMGNSGTVRMISSYPFFVFDRTSGLQNKNVLLAIVIFTIAVLVLTLLAWPVTAIIRRHYQNALTLSPAEIRMRRITRIILLIDLICLIAYAFFVIEGFESISILSSKSDSAIRIFQFLALIGVLGTLFVFYNTYRAWLSSNRRIWGKLYESAVALACITFVFLVFYGHLLDFSLHY